MRSLNLLSYAHSDYLTSGTFRGNDKANFNVKHRI